MSTLSTAEINVRRRLRPEAVVEGNTGMYGGYDEQMQGKVREDIRDRAAFVYITGSFPTHLRRNYNAVLRAVTQYFKSPQSLDRNVGNLAVNKPVVGDLDLDHHPMVKEVRSRIAHGYAIQPARFTEARRPYSKVFLYRKEDPSDRVTVQVDGSVKKNWD